MYDDRDLETLSEREAAQAQIDELRQIKKLLEEIRELLIKVAVKK